MLDAIAGFLRQNPWAISVVMPLVTLWVGRRWANRDLQRRLRRVFDADLSTLSESMRAYEECLAGSKRLDRAQLLSWLQTCRAHVLSLQGKYQDALGPPEPAGPDDAPAAAMARRRDRT